VVSVHVDGTMDLVLTTRIETLLDLLSRGTLWMWSSCVKYA
jgi:hypothetical protein